MSKKKDKIMENKRLAKRAAVLGNEKKRSFPLFPVLICTVLLAVGLFLYFGPVNKNKTQGNSQFLPDSMVSQITYPLDLFNDNKAHHFEYKDHDITIRYFILKSSDGVIRAAFDACDVCWQAGKGYYQEGDQMVCRNCGRRFASILINEVKGGCNPAPLQRSIKDNNLIIQTSDILDGKQYFDLSGKV